MDEYRVDGFRFDGVTSMLYTGHGLARVFTSYDDYFGPDIDEDALTYLSLANDMIHDLNPQAITIAEDVSGFPALAIPLRDGGAGFDYRFAMGIADHCIELTKDVPDEEWSLGELWYELNNRRRGEATISYAESHDQALVGDQTLIFRLLGPRMYDRMASVTEDLVVQRGIALHKMIRLVTLANAGAGYLTFMGNEFGHPEWIDFPREGNDWSYAHAHRQWYLADDPALRYRHLAAFDRGLMTLAHEYGVPDGEESFLLHIDEEAKVLAWLRAGLVFVASFHPNRSFPDYRVPAPPGTFQIVLDTDRSEYGGFDRRDATQHHHALPDRIQRHFLSLYLPSRTAMVLAPVEAARR
jgi:1,4-alpha-glucan branching enzyme